MCLIGSGLIKLVTLKHNSSQKVFFPSTLVDTLVLPPDSEILYIFAYKFHLLRF